jgi:hypothetical protein
MNDTPFRVMLALACLTSLVACNGAKSGAEAAVRESLKDPGSAKFGDFYYNDEKKRGCLTVNARNSMGGYTGDQQAYVQRGDSGWEVYGIAEITQTMCREGFADVAL